MINTIIADFEQQHDCKVIYLTKSGSQLYGTNTPESDTDYHGIFLPSRDSLITQTAIDHWTHTTGNSNSKNSSIDLDLTLWSIHKLLHLLTKGETGAIDLLFSMQREDTQLITTKQSTTLYQYAIDNLLSKNVQAFLGYAIGQSQRYGIKGARYKELFTFTNWLNTTGFVTTLPISSQLPLISNHIDNKQYKYISVTRAPGPKGGNQHELIDYIEILGKKHANNITMGVLAERCQEKLSYAGNRTISAMDGTDWKALSNAYRVTQEVHELLIAHTITFPLNSAKSILEMKQGKMRKEFATKLVQDCIDVVDKLIDESTLPSSVPVGTTTELLLLLYKD